MAWVALDRADRLLGGRPRRTSPWRSERNRVLIALLRDGWSERLASFRGVLGEDVLDATALLPAVLQILPGDDPRLASTIDRLEEQLGIDGFLYRFRPKADGRFSPPFGEFEAASTVATVWLAAARAWTDRPDAADETLNRLEQAAPLGLFSEAVDPRGPTLLGNFPSTLAHAEHIRCLHLIAQARPVDRLKLMIGEAERRLLGRPQPLWST
jgi:GH15 family glucan-1,4-alpha-glucosidase